MTLLRIFFIIVGILFVCNWLVVENTLWLDDCTDNRAAQSNGSESFQRYGQSGFKKIRRSIRSLNNDTKEIGKINSLSQLLRIHIDEFRLDTDRVEIVFLVDASSSVGQENFQSELNFLRKLLSDLSVDQTATRVAVVTFAGKGMIHRNIDQITSLKFIGNKCILLNAELRRINYTGGGTYTRGALLEALEILRKSRQDARKVVFLITDGFSNGGDPRPVADKLKNLGAVILTFGIRTGNIEELHDVASEPGDSHSYLLDSFKEFEALARHALHRDLREGKYVVLESKNPCNFLCNTSHEALSNEEKAREINNCCDELAECTCGTTSGHYACLCPVGYYGSGLTGNCHPCRNGTYGKSKSPGDSSSTCLPCPNVNHITMKIPAVSPKDCICPSGFITNGPSCQAITCPKLKVPENGYLVKASACNNVVNAACGLRCIIGFRLVGDSIRLCSNDGNWSGNETECLLKTCPALRPPVHGQVECEHDEEYGDPNLPKLDPSSLPIDARCQFKCDQGYQLLGSKVRNCLPVSRWDGLKVTCKQIKCEPLKAISNGAISPDACLGPKKLPFGANCSISCTDGFALEGPAVRRCSGSRGLWSQRHRINKCVDKTPPVIRCPSNSTWMTLPGKRYSSPTWKAPFVTDNTDKHPRVWSKPHLRFPWRAKIGEQIVTYVAQDSAGNRARCRFSITTLDTEPPQVENCRDPPTFLSTNPRGAENITWDEPVFHDNSGKPVKIKKSHKQNSLFPVGTTSITYSATDQSKNTVHCSINIRVKNVCEESQTLINGNANCHGSSTDSQCIITCNDGYIYPLGPDDSEQVIIPCSDETIWNDSLSSTCSLTELPESVESTGIIILESNETLCSDPSLLDNLKTRITQDLSRNIPESCSRNGLNCHSSQIDFNCTESPHITSIRKRSPEPPRTSKRKRDRIEIKFRIIGKIISDYRKNPKRGIQKLRNELLALIKSGKLNLLNERTNREIANLALNIKTIFSDEVKDVCEPGRVMRKLKCAKCPSGTFHNTTRGTCQPCGLSEYQDAPGSIACKKCPRGTSTRRIHSVSRSECIDQCQPGYYSKRKYHNDQKVSLEPCTPCDLGFYQPHQGATGCYPCPMNSTTESTASRDMIQCRIIEPDLCQSDSCFNGGICSSDGFGYSCECPRGFTGSRCENFRDPCESSPCFNEGSCHFVRNLSNIEFYVCHCSARFTGANCESYIDECASNPCRNNGICVSSEADYQCHCSDGFGGEFCEIPLDLCQSGTCEEGSTCVITNNTWKCLCKPGYLGRHCQLVPCDWLPCHPNAICINIEESNATHDSFRCDCPTGFTGDDCSIRIDHCENLPCENSGICVNNLSNFSCDCPLGFDGDRCEIKLPSDFVMNFVEPGTTDFVLFDGPRENLSEFSISFWIQSGDTFNYGTVFSYATSFDDNTITLTDYNGLVFYVNGDKVVTDISLNDGFWHFLCVTWNIQGTWFIYVDGQLKEYGRNLSSGLSIPGNGSIAIGQEQDEPRGGFSASESFLGKLALLDIWRTSLPEDIIKNLGETCEEYSGTLIPWSSMLRHVHGNIRILKSPFCKGCALPDPPIRGYVNISENGEEAVYSCEPGYLFHHGFKVQSSLKRRCLKQGQWEGRKEPICTKVFCGFPGYFPRGRVFGNSFYFSDEVHYVCEDGYELRGNPHRVCNSDGHWTGRPPICIGVTCRSLLAPANGDIEYIIEEHERDDITILQVGQQLEFRCSSGFELVGEKILTCSTDGQWDHRAPRCEAIGCFPPAPPLHAFFNVTGNGTLVLHGDTLEAFCSSGFVFDVDNDQDASRMIKCWGGTWSGNISDCRPLRCALPSILHGNVRNALDEATLGSKLVFDCEEGFRRIDEEIMCGDNGNWSTPPECQPIKCPSLSSHPIASLFINKPSTTVRQDPEISGRMHQLTLAIEGDKFGDNLVLRCSDGPRDLIVNGTRHQGVSWRCDGSGKWSLQQLDNLTVDDNELRKLLLSEDLCEAMCPPPMIPANALLVTQNVTEWRVNITVTYQCRSGFVLQGFGNSTCTTSGTWSGLSLCVPVNCSDPPKLMNGELVRESNGSDLIFGRTITYKCIPGYRMYGQGSIKCLASGKWSRAQGKCTRISCGKPKVNQNVRLEGKSYLYQEELGYFCGNGEKGKIKCLQTGKWSKIPTC